MLEMADHIGAYDTMRIIAAYGGQLVSIPKDPARSPFRALVSADQAARLAWVYGRQDLELPVARTAVARARRRSVLAAVKARQIDARDAAVILGTSRNWLRTLLSRPDETEGVALAPVRRAAPDTRQITIFDFLD